jgi:hypothetical protein
MGCPNGLLEIIDPPGRPIARPKSKDPPLEAIAAE